MGAKTGSPGYEYDEKFALVVQLDSQSDPSVIGRRSGHKTDVVKGAYVTHSKQVGA